jgi:hypothetical protein
MITGVSYGVAGFIGFIAALTFYIHVVRRRLAPVPHILTLWLAIAGGVVVAVLWLEPRHVLILAITNVCVYLFAGEIVLFVYAASVGSISIRLLVVTRGMEGLPESFERTLRRYSPESFLDIRLGTLLAKGLLIQDGGRYRITTRGRQWARVVRSLKRLFAVGAGG